MTEKEFMDEYLENPCFENFEEPLEFLRNQIDDEFKNKYSITEILLSVIDCLRDNHYPEELYSLWLLIKEKYSDFYHENFEEIDFKVIEYLLCKKKFDEIESPLDNIINDPTKDLFRTIICYNHLMCYQQTEYLDEAIIRNYEELAEHENTTPMIAENYAFTKFYLLIQEMYENKEFDRKRLSDELAIYDFEFNDKLFEHFEQNWFKPDLNEGELIKIFKGQEEYRHKALNAYFQKYMHERGFNFYLSYHLTYIFDIHLESNNYDYDDFDEYYSIKENLFSGFIESLYINFYRKSPSRIFFILWGLVYFYDFLLESGYISKSVYDNAQKIILEEKAWAILMFNHVLWSNNFVHHWQKPDSINEEEFENEEIVFLNSMGFLKLPYQDFLEINQEELKEIGELYNRMIYITNNYFPVDYDEGINDDDEDEYEDDDDDFFDDDKEDDDDESYTGTYIRKVKIGRNEPCPCGSGKKYKYCCGKD